MAAILALSAVISYTASAEATNNNMVNITVSTLRERKTISPYIYGVSSELMDKNVSATAIRAGGNRFSAYNWETNASNAGSDWKHVSDDYFQQMLPNELDDIPAVWQSIFQESVLKKIMRTL